MKGSDTRDFGACPTAKCEQYIKVDYDCHVLVVCAVKGLKQNFLTNLTWEREESRR